MPSSPVATPIVLHGWGRVTFMSAQVADTVVLYAVHQLPGGLSGGLALRHVVQVAHKFGCASIVLATSQARRGLLGLWWRFCGG